MTSEQTIAIKVESISKVFPLRHPRVNERGVIENEHIALHNVSFEVKKGESVGIFGHNGSGKSTLLKILAGVTKPSSGKVTIRGKVASILDIGAGFHPELSGRENIYLNGQIHGFSKKDIDSKYNEIVSFSGIESFIDEPVKNYSNGMYLRLAFSIMAHLDFDIYLFDEVFNVGDAEFSSKIQQKLSELFLSNKTKLFVSHNIKELSQQKMYILLEKGKIETISQQKEILTRYLENTLKIGHQIFNKNVILTDFSKYPQSSEIKVTKIEWTQKNDGIFTTDKPFTFTIHFEKLTDTNALDFFLIMDDIQDNVILSTTPLLTGYPSSTARGKYTYSCIFPPSIFGFQAYRLSVFFIKNTTKTLKDESSSIKLSHDSISEVSSTSLRMENLLIFKPQFRLGNLDVSLDNLNIVAGLLPSFTWEKF
jgi:lipopolysaccharide transport system ATP-binding protein